MLIVSILEKMIKSKAFSGLFFGELGFKNCRDYLKTVFGFKDYIYISWESIAAAFAAIMAFTDQYVWSPPAAISVIFILVVADMITGAIVAVKVKKEIFDPKKWYRSVPVLASHAFVFIMIHNITKIEPTLGFMSNVTFGWFAMRNLISVIYDLVALKYMRAEFLNYFRTKTPGGLVDSVEKTLEKDKKEELFPDDGGDMPHH